MTMHVLYIHRIFPAQFGHIARHLAQHEGIQCTYVYEEVASPVGMAGTVRYTPDFPAGTQLGLVVPASSSSNFFQFNLGTPPPRPESQPGDQYVEGIRLLTYSPVQSDTALDSLILRGHAVYQVLKSHPEVQPDLVVGPGLYASALFLPDLYHCPVINYFDYLYRPGHSHLGFRPEFPPTELELATARGLNALGFIDLDNCAAGYSPTHWQRSLFPLQYQSKIQVIFDGIDREFWYRRSVPRRIGSSPPISAETRIVTYVARGLESIRGFDIFMKVAKRICDVRSDVLFVVVGSEDFYHGPDLRHIREKSFLQHVLKQDTYDLSRFLFTGRIPSSQLVEILSLSDLHVYLTVPFIPSWSLMNALACGCTVLASNTAPVQEIIQHEHNGLLADFFDVDGLTREALRVLDEPARYRPLAEAGVRLIDEKYSLARTVPQMLSFYRRTVDSFVPSASSPKA
jgi:glycosyltransferase involved in cell wall biosynthesis